MAELEASYVGCGCGHHTAEPTAPQAEKCNCQGLMRYRKAHSLAGALFGLFAVVHLAISSTGLFPEKFDQNAQALHTLASNIPGSDLLVTGVPLLVIVPCGLYLLWRAGLKYNVKKCKRGGKLRFFLQRISALALMVFLAVHLASFGPLAISRSYNPANPYRSTVAGIHGSSGVATVILGTLYLAGIVAVAFHLANGLWTSAIAWKLADDPATKANLDKLALAIGLLIAGIGLLAWIAFVLPG